MNGLAIVRYINCELNACTDDELRVVARLVERLSAARSKYGGLDARRDKRNFRQERADEHIDALFYLCAEEVAAMYHPDDPQGSPRLASSHRAPAAGIEAGNSSAAPPQDAVDMGNGDQPPRKGAPAETAKTSAATESVPTFSNPVERGPTPFNYRPGGHSAGCTSVATAQGGVCDCNPVERGLRELRDACPKDHCPHCFNRFDAGGLCPRCGEPHAEYGSCDAFGPGDTCFECNWIARMNQEARRCPDPDATGPFETEDQ